MTAQVVLEKFESSYTPTATLNGVAIAGQKTLLVSGKPVSLNFFFVNTGSATADKVGGWSKIYVGPENESQLIPKFKAELARVRLGQGGTIQTGGHDEFWMTAQSDRPITSDDITKLSLVQEQLYAFVHLEYSDATGKHFQNLCRYLQAPNKDDLGAEPIWHFCNDWSDHN